MSHVRYVLEDGSSVLFEVDSSTTGSGPQPVSRLGNLVDAAEGSLDASLESIRRAAQNVITKLRAAAPDQPTEVELTFGIKAVAEAQVFAIAKAAGEANYAVKLKWIMSENNP